MGGLLTLRDVTEQRMTMRALVASEERFRQLADHIDEAFWIISVMLALASLATLKLR